jgi:hypothetical protein
LTIVTLQGQEEGQEIAVPTNSLTADEMEKSELYKVVGEL